MEQQEADRPTQKYPMGDLLIEGKTKKLFVVEGGKDGLVIVASKDDITAGDGAKHDVIEGKARYSNQTACNVFRLLEACDVETAFVEQDSATSFVARNCDMLPYEVVVRREAHGSYLKRNPHLTKGHLFQKLLVEFFLKTSGKKWGEHNLVCDDPLMEFGSDSDGEIRLFDPAQPINGQEPFLILQEDEVLSHDFEKLMFDDMLDTARRVFLILEKAWQLHGGKLVDFKIEFGLHKWKLLLSDVIDNDSWRVIESNVYIDKQIYRDGAPLDAVADNYRRVAEITSRFN